MSQRRLVKIASGCKTEEQFVAVFNRFCDGQSIFIATRTPKPVGETLQFCVTLADGKPLLAGTGSVSESYEDKSGPFLRPGMRITFGQLDDNSEPILTKLTQAKRRPKPAKKPAKPVLGVPPVLPKPAVAPEPAAPVAAPPEVPAAEPKKDPELRDPEGTKKTFGLPPPIVKTPPPPIPSPAPRARAPSVDEAWDDATTDVKTPVPMAHLSSLRALGSESESTAMTKAEGEAGSGDGDERAPGSELILPANPFGELESESLEHFIECTIYEERAPTSEPPGDESEDNIVVPANPFMADDRSGKVVSGVLGDDKPAVVVDKPPEVATRQPAPVAPEPAAPEPIVTVAVPSPRTERSSGDPLISLLWAAGAVAATLVAGLVLGYLIWGGDEQPGSRVSTEPASIPTASAPSPQSRPEPALVADAAVAVVAADAAVTTPDAGAVDTPDAAAEPAADDRCSLDVSTDPEGSVVRLGAKKLGKTPGEFEVPCKEIEVTIDHPRYEALTKTVTASAGEPVSIRGRLERPRFRLRIRTRPSGAWVWVDGRKVGSSPVTLTVLGFERSKVVASKPGYRPTSKRVYLKRNGGVTLNLRRASRRRR